MTNPKTRASQGKLASQHGLGGCSEVKDKGKQKDPEVKRYADGKRVK